MARVKKTLIPEQGYPHREHRSKAGREANRPYRKRIRNKLRRIKERRQLASMGVAQQRKGKW